MIKRQFFIRLVKIQWSCIIIVHWKWKWIQLIREADIDDPIVLQICFFPLTLDFFPYFFLLSDKTKLKFHSIKYLINYVQCLQVDKNKFNWSFQFIRFSELILERKWLMFNFIFRFEQVANVDIWSSRVYIFILQQN